jgi:hypothetical protein
LPHTVFSQRAGVDEGLKTTVSIAVRSTVPFIAVLLASCYRYTPGPAPAAAPGAYVRLVLREPTPSDLIRVLGAETIAVEGKVVSTSEAAYRVAVSATLKPPTVSNTLRRTVWAGEEVVIPREAVGGTELRSLDRKLTTRVVALGAVAAIVAVKLVMSVGGSSGGGDDGGGGVTPP